MYEHKTVLRMINHSKVLYETFKIRSKEFGSDDAAKLWIYEHVIKNNSVLSEQYEGLLPDYTIPVPVMNSLADKIEALIAEYTWPVFRQAMIDIFTRKLEKARFIGLPTDQLEKMVAKMESMYKHVN
jgi:hypothetical protein